MIASNGAILQTKDMYGNIIERPETDADFEFLGKGKQGHLYWLNHRDRYVYQQFPVDKEYWWMRHNQQGQMNGWFCSQGAWERALHNIVDKKECLK